MLAGALTSTPTLVGAQDAVSSGVARIPGSLSPQDVIKNISVAYSLTYLFGMGGLSLYCSVYSGNFLKLTLLPKQKSDAHASLRKKP